MDYIFLGLSVATHGYFASILKPQEYKMHKNKVSLPTGYSGNNAKIGRPKLFCHEVVKNLVCKHMQGSLCENYVWFSILGIMSVWKIHANNKILQI
jgi:hypothetical protein